MVPSIVAFHGQKRSGKNESARIMISITGGREYSFARRIKNILSQVYGLTSEETDGVYKERPFEYPIAIDDALSSLSALVELDLQPRGLVARTPRELMQFFGTEYVRSIQDDYWVAYLMALITLEREAQQLHGTAYITDCRFENERRAVYVHGGVVCHLRRDSVASSELEHQSEQLLPVLPGDHVVYNNDMLLGLERRLRRSFKLGT